MEEPYDIAIVGAGPAGTTAAYAAARRGLRVALIDRQTFPRDKACGDGIDPGAVARQLGHALDQLAPMIEKNISELEESDQHTPASLIKTHYTLSSALQLRAAIAAQNPAPVFNTLARAATTLALPLFLTLIQIASTAIR